MIRMFPKGQGPDKPWPKMKVKKENRIKNSAEIPSGGCDHSRRWTRWRKLSTASPLYGVGRSEIRKCNLCLEVELR